MKGRETPSESSTSKDNATGIVVRQMTQANAISHPSYFLQSSFLPGEKGIVFTSYRTGSAQLFTAGYPSGPVRQLTEGASIHPFSPAMHPGGDNIVFTRGGSVWTVRLDSLEERCIVDFGTAQLGECSLSRDGEWLTAAIRKDGNPGLAAGRFDGSGWHIIPFGRTVIHPQFHPLEPEWIEFSGDPAPRMHRVRRDGSGLECLHEHGNDEFIVHETFLGSTGDLVFTVWPKLVCRMDWTTREIRNIAEYNAWHIAPNRAGTKILCDTNHPDRGIRVLDVATGERPLVCQPRASNQGSQWTTSRYALAADFEAARSAAKSENLSWMETATDTVYGPQWTHPHPSWSTDETKIAFASDRGGVTQAYVAELKGLDL